MNREAGQLEALFRDCFFDEFNTQLIGGADEPIYLPADARCPHHRIVYREDYFSSALHEVAHWCIAGEERRKMVDFGYWYSPDGRTAAQQRAFEQVEIKPQALEWLFSAAAGIKFIVSADNLSADSNEACEPSQDFLEGLKSQVSDYCEQGLPERAERFIQALANYFGADNPLDRSRHLERFSQ